MSKKKVNIEMSNMYCDVYLNKKQTKSIALAKNYDEKKKDVLSLTIFRPGAEVAIELTRAEWKALNNFVSRKDDYDSDCGC